MDDWRDFETILLDMDGTILDLAFDNYFWRQLVPRCLARACGAAQPQVTAALFDGMPAGRAASTGIASTTDTRAGARSAGTEGASSHRVRFLAGATGFLDAVQRAAGAWCCHQRPPLHAGGQKGVTGMERWIDTFVSSHDFGAPKNRRLSGRRSRISTSTRIGRCSSTTASPCWTAAGFGIRGIWR